MILKILKNLREFVNSNKILSAILGVNLLIHGIGITWGLPNFDSWAIDAVVPSGVLKGLAKGFSFGFVYHYPMAHLVILSILILPILIIGAIHALVLHSPSEIKMLLAKTKTLPPLEQWELVQTILPIKYYTSAIILIGNIESLFMSIGIVYFTYKIVKEIFDEKKALFSAALLTFNASFNYYSHTANLDVPYIFWGLFALYHLVLAVKYNKKENYIYCAITTVLCFGTKDQGYALFVIPFIIYLLIIPFINRQDKSFWQKYKKNFFLFTVFFIVGFVIVENLLLNYSGFIMRIKTMTGENTEGYTPYVTSLAGYASLFKDLLPVYIKQIVSLPVAIATLVGILFLFILEKKDKSFVLTLLPLFSALSFIIFFVMVVKRSDHRFILAPSILLTVYGGYTFALLYEKLNKNVFWIIFSPMILYMLIFAVNVNVNLLLDKRYEVTEWMKENLPSGTRIEHYEDYVYLPQFPENIREYRIKKDFDNIAQRNPDYIIISSKWYRRFFKEIDLSIEDGKKISERDLNFKTSQQGDFIRKLFEGNTPYNKKFVFRHTVPWPFRADYVTEEIVIFGK